MIIVTGAVRFGNGEIERLRSALVNAVESTRKEAGCRVSQLRGRPPRAQFAEDQRIVGGRGCPSTPIRRSCPS